MGGKQILHAGVISQNGNAGSRLAFLSLFSLLSFGTLGALLPRLSFRPLGALRAGVPFVSFVTLRALFPLGALGAGGTRFSLFTLLPLWSLGTLLPLFTPGTLRAGVALLALFAFRTLRAGFSFLSLRTLGTLGTPVSRVPLLSLRALFPLLPSGRLVRGLSIHHPVPVLSDFRRHNAVFYLLGLCHCLQTRRFRFLKHRGRDFFPFPFRIHRGSHLQIILVGLPHQHILVLGLLEAHLEGQLTVSLSISAGHCPHKLQHVLLHRQVQRPGIGRPFRRFHKQGWTILRQIQALIIPGQKKGHRLGQMVSHGSQSTAFHRHAASDNWYVHRHLLKRRRRAPSRPPP